jgi:hypothetical protein
MVSVMADGRWSRDDALAQLPLTYSVALRLRDAGIPEELIAQCVGVAAEAMPTFMNLAQAKLAAAGFTD